jgi:putative tricarboxylic transport membrane protein
LFGRIKNRKDFASSIFLVLLGVFLISQSRHYSVWGRSGPQAGFFPLVIGIIISGFSLVILIQSFVLDPAQGNEQAKEAVSSFRVSSYALSMVLYGLLMTTLGFFISTLLFLFLIVKYGEKQGWKTTLIFGLATTLLSYLLFRYWLGVPLPLGFMKGWQLL